MTQVLKFGGTSVANSQNINKVIDIVCLSAANKKTFVVVSAFSGVTDILIETAKLASIGNETYKEKLQTLEDRHIQAVKELIPVTQLSSILSAVKNQLNELESLCEGVYLLRELSPRSLDSIVAYGEKLSSIIISKKFESIGFSQLWVDSRALIRTDNNFTCAQVNFEITNKQINAFFKDKTYKLYLLPGFIAADENNNTTTLGRGGSDYTAAILAGALNARQLEIWTDVSGMMTADPRLVENAQIIDKISYKEAMELSHFGAKVIYPPTIQPAMNGKIPIIIKNTFAPQDPGTSIEYQVETNNRTVCGISGISKIALLSLEGPGMIGIPGFSARLFKTLASEKISVILITQGSSEHSICVAIDEQYIEKALNKINEEFNIEILQQRLSKALFETGRSIVAVVGDKMKNHPGISGKMFSALGRNGINVRAIAQGSSEMNISAVIDSVDLKKAINVLHETFFEEESKQLNLFLAGSGNVGSKLIELFQQQLSYLKKEMNLHVKVVAIANSKKALFNTNGINLSNWEIELKQAPSSNLKEFIQFIGEQNLPNSVFIDVTASEEAAKSYSQLLQRSIAVVACNKIACSMPLPYYKSLKKYAREYNTSFLYETNVGAGLPIIKTLNDLVMSGDRVHKIEAVLSGSLNFIFNHYNGTQTFTDIVKKAAAEGYTEPDPRIDLSGKDVARKILILAREAGLNIEMEDVAIQSFLPNACLNGSIEDFYTELPRHEEHFKKLYLDATEKQSKLKFVASFEKNKATVGLQMVNKNHDLYKLEGKDNVVLFYTERYGEQALVIKGAGAGAAVTAAGVFSDVLRTIKL